MENFYESIAARTGGNIYIGVVGPVRTGKSTLIKRIMEQLVIPNINDPHRKERAKDELPQSGSGRTIMTTEPKFIPEEAAEIMPDDKTTLRFRMIDSVGYMIPGAIGAEEDGTPRMVVTPWFDHELSMTDAAELGTKKVMEEHCTIGLVVTTDGSITDIPREDYEEAEAQAINDMQKTGKPYLVIINSKNTGSPAAKQVKEKLLKRYNVNACIADCQALDINDIQNLIKQLLYSFPLQSLNIHLPRWIDALENAHPVKTSLYQLLIKCFSEISTLSQAQSTLKQLDTLDAIQEYALQNIDLSTGTVSYSIQLPETLFYEILSSKTGMEIADEAQLLSLLIDLSAVKAEYDKIADALSSVNATGYGIVMPNAEQMTMQTPEVVRKGGAFGVKLKAGAPSIHMIRVDIDTEISPMVGGEQQSQNLITYLSSEEPDKLWQSNIFGKSVYNLIQESLTSKLLQTPEDVREKFRGTLTRIVNEGAKGLVCLII